MMKTFDDTYISVLRRILSEGVQKHNRTGMDTLSVFCDTIEGGDTFPVSNLRKIHYRGAIIETLWLLGLHAKDERYRNLPLTNIKYLQDHKVNYWNPWADENGNLGPVYGEQLVRWKQYNGKKQPVMDEEDTTTTIHIINQVQGVIDKLRINPDDRRLVCTMWNPSELDKMALPPCHHTHEYYSRPTTDGRRFLDLRWFQRSCDMPLGIPYNILQYTILCKIVALCTGHELGRVYGCLGDAHVYVNQLDGVRELIRRYDAGEHLSCPKPRLEISERLLKIQQEKGGFIDLSDIAIDGSDFIVCDYAPLFDVKMPVSV